MARPRVFVSSTYYDLKHLRSSLELFIESLGYEAVLSEKGSIAYAPDVPLDESCYREVVNADMFVLIIGGRYGSERSGPGFRSDWQFYERYESITKLEYTVALAQNIPTYILVEGSVLAEYKTFGKNRVRKDVDYAHVDSINIFYLLEHVLAQLKGNPVFPFNSYDQIEPWLKEQWAGLFRGMLHRMSSQQQLSSLQEQVSELSEINRTMKRYLEELMAKVAPAESSGVIASETSRLENAKILEALGKVTFARMLDTAYGIPIETVRTSLEATSNLKDFLCELVRTTGLLRDSVVIAYAQSEPVQRDYELAMSIIRRQSAPVTVPENG